MKSRKAAELSERFNKRWLGYAAAAGAAGVGLLSTTPTAKADIVFDPGSTAWVGCSLSGQIACLNLQVGTPGADLAFTMQSGEDWWGSGSSSNWERFGLAARSAAPSLKGIGFLSHLQGGGASIGAGRAFNPGYATLFYSGNVYGRYPLHIKGGAWYPPNPTSGYLGLEFEGTDGQVHYGWAYFTGINGLNGAAYDTVPDQRILAGQTTATPEPGTLGLLALGSLGLGFWRRRAGTSEK